MSAHNALRNLELASASSADGTSLNMGNISPTFEDIVIQDAVSLGASVTVSNPLGRVGYATGAGGTETQATSMATLVGISPVSACGQITTFAADSGANTIASGGIAQFTVSCSGISSGDIIHLTMATQFAQGLVIPFIKQMGTNSFVVNLYNISGTAVTSGAAVINWAIFKSVIS